eukprot:GHRQ01022718.1.p1 GENE.GHRQ01022718.1~~GHRQ01022718.1.p1  ORF type:complete len:107 (-),score=33.26 GHRQ01022718.1:523-843(-)
MLARCVCDMHAAACPWCLHLAQSCVRSRNSCLTPDTALLWCATPQTLQVWGQDAVQFRPERWLEEGGAAQRVAPYSYMPFSRGPRNCIGAQFALLEAKTILAMLLR